MKRKEKKNNDVVYFFKIYKFGIICRFSVYVGVIECVELFGYLFCVMVLYVIILNIFYG